MYSIINAAIVLIDQLNEECQEQDSKNLFTLQQIIYAKLVKHMHGQYGLARDTLVCQITLDYLKEVHGLTWFSYGL